MVPASSEKGSYFEGSLQFSLNLDGDLDQASYQPAFIWMFFFFFQFYKLCQKWRTEIKKNPQTLIELEAFLRSDLLTDVVSNISKRYNLPEGELKVGKKYFSSMHF